MSEAEPRVMSDVTSGGSRPERVLCVYKPGYLCNPIAGEVEARGGQKLNVIPGYASI